MRNRGSALAMVLLALVVVSALVVAGARHRTARVLAARVAWQDAAASALAQSGIEATRAAIRRGVPVPARPLGDTIDLGDGARGTLEVVSEADGWRSCGVVGARGSCVVAVVGADGNIRDWREFQPR